MPFTKGHKKILGSGRNLSSEVAEAIRTGAKRYSNGKPCLRGHVAERQLSNNACVVCERERGRTTEAKQRVKQFHENNRESVRGRKRAWFRSLPIEKKARHYALCAGYAERVKRATPKWADMGAITTMYQQAKRLGLEVDHVVPLQGKNVCGLHVENNLQHLTMEANRRKNNRFEEAP